jgi:hypothetical protein
MQHKHSVARRRLVLTAPLASFTALAPAITFAQSDVADATVSVLLPKSERIPSFRIDWQQGFQAELLAAGAALRPQYVEYPSGSYRALSAAQSLLDAGCTTLTGIFSRNLATHLGPSLERHSARFMVSDLGANAIRGDQRCDRLTRVGPNLWQQSYQAGQHFAQRGAKRALIATSFYEAGYDLPSAFKQGFMDAGGNSAQIVVTGTPDVLTNDLEFVALADALAGNTYDVLFSLYSGREAIRYLQFAQTIRAGIGTRAALSPLLHGLPPNATTLASEMAFEIVTASVASGTASELNETIYMSMGRVAARAVLNSLGSTCQRSAEWSVAITRTALTKFSGQAEVSEITRFGALSLASPWPPGITSGWLAPYGA